MENTKENLEELMAGEALAETLVDKIEEVVELPEDYEGIPLDNMKPCWDLDEKSGIIALDSYIANFGFEDNAKHLDEILTKVPAQRFLDRLNFMDNDLLLNECFTGSALDIHQNMMEFIEALNLAAGTNKVFKDSHDIFEPEISLTLEEQLEAFKDNNNVETFVSDNLSKVVDNIFEKNSEIIPNDQNNLIELNDLMSMHTYIVLYKEGVKLSSINFMNIRKILTLCEQQNALITADDENGNINGLIGSFHDSITNMVEKLGIDSFKVYSEFPRVIWYEEGMSDTQVTQEIQSEELENESK